MVTNVIDKGIGVAIMLFILSMISERVVTWIKIHFGKEGKSFLKLYNPKKKDLRSKSSNVDGKEIEAEVLGLNIAVSIIISLSSNADFFAIFRSGDPFRAIGWSDVSLSWTAHGVLYAFQALIGCALTGLFISLGSKFWHDTLDLLFYTKNLREKASDRETYKINDLRQLDDYLALSGQEIVKLAIDQNSSFLKIKFPNINFITDSVIELNGIRENVVAIYLLDGQTLGLPVQLPVKFPSGLVQQLKTQIITNVGIGSVSGGLDGPLAKIGTLGYQGSACCLARDLNNKYFMLTNCHVMTDGERSNPLFNTAKAKAYYNNILAGSWEYGIMNTNGDFALILLKNPPAFITKYQPEKFNDRFKKVSHADYFKPVQYRGNLSEGKAYIVEMAENQIAIRYKYDKEIIFKEAILIGDRPDRDNCLPVTTFGDSGGIVYDDQMNIIGMITGTIQNKYTIVIPFDELAKNHSLTIY